MGGPRGLIIGAGEPIDDARLRDLARLAGLIIAADGGFMAAMRAGVEVHAVVGDFDSISTASVAEIETTRRIGDPAQVDSDLEKAIRLAIQRGAIEADMAGVTGSRLDHSVNALNVIIRFSDQIDLRLHDNGGYASMAKHSPMTLEGNIGDRVSFIPAPEARGLWSEGLRFPLRGLTLHFGGRDAISNEIVSLPATVSWREGRFFVYRQLPPSEATDRL